MNGSEKTTVFCVLIIALLMGTIAAIASWRNNEIMHSKERIIFQEKVSPAVLSCLDAQDRWNSVSVYEICKRVLTESNLSDEEKKSLVERLK